MTFQTSWQIKHRQEFFKPLIPSDALIFDIGANIGEYTAAFLSIGARQVVAVEPQPELCAFLLEAFPATVEEGRLTIRCVALGERDGTMILNISGNENRCMSTLSPLFLEISERNGDNWTNKSTAEVPVTTLDTLISEFGIPDYLKIDVEGFDLEVLKGLGTPVPFLSFEFNTQSGLIDISSLCISKMSSMGMYEFNYQAEAPGKTAIQLDNWVSGEVMNYILRHDLCRARMYGDIFCRLKS